MSRRLRPGDYTSSTDNMQACPECRCDDTLRITPVMYFGCGLEIDRIRLKEGDQFRVVSSCRRKDQRGQP